MTLWAFFLQCQEGASDKLWNVEHVDRVSDSVYGLSRHTVSLCGWSVVFLALWFLFAAQFSTFPWPDDKPTNDPDRLLLNGLPPAAFFKECVPPASLYSVFLAAWVIRSVPLSEVMDTLINAPGFTVFAFGQQNSPLQANADTWNVLP